MNHEKLSRYLSLILRHAPERAGLTLDAQGWVGVPELIRACKNHGHQISREILDEVVATNSKKRFAFNEDGTKIRASQGHSIDVDLGLAPVEPPEFLFHGTAMSSKDSILGQGLEKRTRQHVHLSADEETARNVGSRHGKPLVFTVSSAKMHAAGLQFFRSANGVWLTDHVPPEYLSCSWNSTVSS